MKTTGSVLLGDVAARATHLDVACTRCSRRGRYRVARLVEQFGGDYSMTNLGAELANCPNRNATTYGERCDVLFPGLVATLGSSE